jgi:RND family efflux transporter MFP subunit
VGRIEERVLLTGALKPKEQVDVTAKATGRVIQLSVNVGDVVQQGQVIAMLEDSELQQQVASAEAALAVTQASLSQRGAELQNAELALKRAETLMEGGLIPAQDFETQKTSYQVLVAQVELARAQKRQAEAALKELNIRLEQSKIEAPINGQIANRYVDVGAVVGPTTPIVQVVNIATLITAASVPESDVSKLRIGNKAEIMVDAAADEVFLGRVARISPVLDPATRTATIEIEIANPQGRLRAEMFVRVELNLESTREAVLIPRESLVYRGELAGVYVLTEDQQPQFRIIETGLTQENELEVLNNLQPGTRVIAKGAGLLREGDRISFAEGNGGPMSDGQDQRSPERAKSGERAKQARNSVPAN